MIRVLETREQSGRNGEGAQQITTACRARVEPAGRVAGLLPDWFATELRDILPPIPAGYRRVALNLMFEADGVTFLYRVADVRPI